MTKYNFKRIRASPEYREFKSISKHTETGGLPQPINEYDNFYIDMLAVLNQCTLGKQHKQLSAYLREYGHHESFHKELNVLIDDKIIIKDQYYQKNRYLLSEKGKDLCKLLFE